MNNKYITKRLAEFDEKYLNKGTPSGLNEKCFKNFPDLVKDIRNFLTESIHQARAEGYEIGRGEPNEVSYEAGKKEERERVVEEIEKMMKPTLGGSTFMVGKETFTVKSFNHALFTLRDLLSSLQDNPDKE